MREVEALGYSTLFVPDHFDEGFGPIAAMASAAAVTTTLKVGALVFDCDYRHPAVLAREMATIDAISEGRLELGLGAGWKRWDYDVTGIPMDAPKVRVDRMIEYTKIVKALFAEEPVTFDGEHYRITDLPGTPRPHTPGGPPILIGGGAKRVLRFAGATADIVGLNASIHSGEIDTAAAHDALPARFDEKLGWVREGAGDRFDDIEINAWLVGREDHRRHRGLRGGDRRAVRGRRKGRTGLAADTHRLDRGMRRPAARTPGALGLLVRRHPAGKRARVRPPRPRTRRRLRLGSLPRDPTPGGGDSATSCGDGGFHRHARADGWARAEVAAPTRARRARRRQRPRALRERRFRRAVRGRR